MSHYRFTSKDRWILLGQRQSRSRNGFTLVELLVVVGIIATLIT